MLATIIPAQWAVAEEPSPSVYKVRGVLKSINPVNHQATIAHEEVPGYMPAMTMSFDVRPLSQLQGLQPGDLVAFHLLVTRHDAWIESLQKTGTSTAPLFTSPPAGVFHELVTGNSMPDIELTDQHSHQFNLSDYRGSAVAFTFIYTRCPLPTYCPLVQSNFHAAQDLMKRLDAGDKWRFVSISIDPVNDTPEVLSNVAGNLAADPDHWVFATGNVGQIRAFGQEVGFEFNTTAGQISHNLRTVVIDPSGRIEHIFRGNSWTAQELAIEMRTAMLMRR